jgi:excisionase family DNA binding protein
VGSVALGGPQLIEERSMIERKITTHADTVLLTFKEAMEFLRVSRSTIYRLMWSGQLRGHKVGSTWRFYEADLLAAVEAATFEPAQPRSTQH